MHEFGHGVYEWGVDRSLARTPLHSGVSLAVHESQSRTWENLVGRRQGKLSVMPEKLIDHLTPAELASILAYLESLVPAK